jgi:hypothetical protein
MRSAVRTARVCGVVVALGACGGQVNETAPDADGVTQIAHADDGIDAFAVDDDNLYYTSNAKLYRVPAAGGTADLVADLDFYRGDMTVGAGFAYVNGAPLQRVRLSDGFREDVPFLFPGTVLDLAGDGTTAFALSREPCASQPKVDCPVLYRLDGDATPVRWYAADFERDDPAVMRDGALAVPMDLGGDAVTFTLGYHDLVLEQDLVHVVSVARADATARTTKLRGKVAAVAADASWLYVLGAPPSAAAAHGTLARMPIAGTGASTPLVDAACGQLAVDATDVFFLGCQGDGIRRVAKSGGAIGVVTTAANVATIPSQPAILTNRTAVYFSGDVPAPDESPRRIFRRAK